jgi:hypothetical protein
MGTGRGRKRIARCKVGEGLLPVDWSSDALDRLGISLGQAIIAFEQGRYDETVNAILPLRNVTGRIGASHAHTGLFIAERKHAADIAIAWHVLFPAWRQAGQIGFLRDTDDTKWPRRDIARKHKLRRLISLVNDVAPR